MASASQLIEYQRRCYEADNRETGITSLLHAKIRHVKFLDGDEVILSGTLPRVPLPRKYADNLRKEAYKYRRDKTLVYAALPIVGCGKSYGSLPDRICAPLVFLNADFTELHGSLFLVPSIDEIRINYPALSLIAEATEADAARLERMLVGLPPLPWPREQLHSLAASLAEVLPGVDFTALSAFPSLFPINQAQAQLACQSAAAVALLPNSPETRGVLYELSQLSASQSFSRPLRCLLDEAQETSSPRWPRRSREPVTPSVLSTAQRQALHAGSQHPLSLIVGPPGTGKSHTIAALALDHLARNQTVLIASRMDQAVDVVASKIEALIGPTDAIVRAGRKAHLRELKNKLENMISGVTTAKGNSTHSDTESRKLRGELRRLDRAIEAKQSRIQALFAHEIAWGSLTVQPSSGFLGAVSDAFARRYRSWRLSDADLWQECHSLQSLIDKRVLLAKNYLRAVLQERVRRMLRRDRGDLTKFLTALRARSDSKQQNLFREISFTRLLHAFPVWLCKLTDLSNVLPWQAGLFDVVILDEATQCDIASCLPLLQRGRRAVVVGDPKQLRHLSFLPDSRQESLAHECQLTTGQQLRFHFRDKSILDAVSDAIADGQRVNCLNEHFRSLPGIIRFSNQSFYADSLAIMREHPETADSGCVQIRCSAGVRKSNGVNAIEADQLVTELLGRIEASSPASPPTIGVLSPFRDQVDYLAKALDRRLSYEQMRRHDLLIGTAHTFQGEERDVMCISLAIDDAAHSATVRFLNTPQLLNVAVTRARELQLLYVSFDRERLDKRSLLYQLLHSVENPTATRSPEPSPVDVFRREVLVELEERGYRTWQDFQIAGEPLDLIAAGTVRSLAFDLIGYPGQMSRAYPLERYRLLHRAGLQVLPLCYREWQQRRDEVLSRIDSAASS